MATTRTIWLARGHTPSSMVFTSRHVLSRHFSNSSVRSVNPLLNLAAFSGAKEAQYLSKERRIPRTEFAPYLELIRSSEVDPFAPAAGTSPIVIAALRKAQRGESDMQTAYSLAISNLVQQLDISRQEIKQTNQALTNLHHKFEKQERHALLIVLCTVGLLSVLGLKTDVYQDLGNYLTGTKQEWKDFDWQWLGNTPPHQKQSQHRLLELEQVRPVQSHSWNSVESTKETAAAPQLHVSEPRADEFSRARPSFVSRLFWAPPS